MWDLIKVGYVARSPERSEQGGKSKRREMEEAGSGGETQGHLRGYFV